MKTRLGVMLSGGGTTLQNLAEVIARGELDAEIVCVISSNPKAYGIVRAEKLGLPVKVISRKSFETPAAFSEAVASELRRHKVDLVCLAGYLSLWPIPPDFAGRVMNIHPALLPKFGGKGMHGHHVHEAVLAAGEAESGCTVHFADNTYDTGPIIVQRRVPVLPGDTADTLAARVFEEEKLAYPEAIRQWIQRASGEKGY
jgi:phosphoribosylglycinamide formyltransferase-1